MPQGRRPAVGGWLVGELESRYGPWRVELPAVVRDELLFATREGLEPRVDDPPLRGLSHADEFVQDLARRLTAGPGFVVVTGFPIDDEDRARDALWAFGRVMGHPVPQSLDGALVGRVEEAGADLENPHHRGHKTNAALPFHVDRTDVIGLLCVRSAANGGLSQIASAAAVHDVLLEEYPELVEELYQPLPQDRRGEQAPGEEPWCPIPVFADVGGRLIVRYVRRFIEASQRHPSAPRLTDAQFRALDALDAVLQRPEVSLSMDLQPGELQLIDNFSILHARSAFTRAPQGAGRLLLRLWLATAISPTLPQSYAPLYGSVAGGTVRGGVWPPELLQRIGRSVAAVR